MSRREDIDNGIWGSPEFMDLKPSSKLVYVWSFTNPLCGMAGLYKMSVRTPAHDTGLAVAAVEQALDELQRARFAFFHEQVLWVRSRVKHLRSRTQQIAISIARDVEKVGAGHPLAQAFLEEYGTDSWLAHTLGAFGRTPPSVPDQSSLFIGDSVNLKGTSLRFQGSGRGKAVDEVPVLPSRVRSRAADQSQLPDSLDSVLALIAGSVLLRLERLQAERGGQVPTLRGVGLALAAFPDRDHHAVLGELEHWALAGSAATRPIKDWARTYRTFLERSPAATPSRPGDSREARRQRGVAALHALTGGAS